MLYLQMDLTDQVKLENRRTCINMLALAHSLVTHICHLGLTSDKKLAHKVVIEEKSAIYDKDIVGSSGPRGGRFESEQHLG